MNTQKVVLLLIIIKNSFLCWPLCVCVRNALEETNVEQF